MATYDNVTQESRALVNFELDQAWGCAAHTAAGGYGPGEDLIEAEPIDAEYSALVDEAIREYQERKWAACLEAEAWAARTLRTAVGLLF
jgi:hypothetical protein